MNHGKCILVAGGLIFCQLSLAQVFKESEQKIVTDLMERWIENTESVLDYTDLQEQLEYRIKHKLNINKADRFAFEQLLFLNETAINAILEHRKVFGDFLSVYELQTIEKLDERTLYFLSYFVKVGDEAAVVQMPFLKQIQKGKHEIIVLGEGEKEQREGYNQLRKETGQTYYMGAPLRIAVRYRFQYNNNLSFGYSGEKDAGEQLTNKGFDFNSAHFCIQNLGKVKTLALGDYQVAFGQGLTFATGLSARKSAYVLNVRKGFQPIRPYRSLNESGFLRGAAILLKAGKWHNTNFISRKRLSTNAQLSNDSFEADGFSSIQASGLHRTETELAQRNNMLQTIIGSHLTYAAKKIEVGITATHAKYGSQLLTQNKPYELYQFNGTALNNFGIDYGGLWRNCSFFGEAAMNNKAGFAMISGVTAALHQSLDWILVYRNYGKKYQSSYNNPFGENAGGQNEKGIYSGVSIKPAPKWVLNLYVDLFKSEWLRYLVDASSQGADYLSELQFNPNKKTQIYVRYHAEEKMRNQPDNSTATDFVSYAQKQQYRLHFQYAITSQFTAKSRLEITRFAQEGLPRQQGAMVYQDVGYTSATKRFSASCRLAIFSVDDYNARIYATEQDVLYQYSVPLYQNSGIRYYALLHWRLNKKMDCWFKFSQTQYSNVQSIGSGLETINGNTISDIRVQLRVTL